MPQTNPKYMAPFEYDDGGKSYSKIGAIERNDCTVRALSIALTHDYDTAHDIYRKAGRKPQKGFGWRTFNDANFERLELERVLSESANAYKNDYVVSGDKFVVKTSTLGQFIEKYPTGTFLIEVGNQTSSHALTIVDGVVRDRVRWGKRKIIQRAWKVK